MRRGEYALWGNGAIVQTTKGGHFRMIVSLLYADEGMSRAIFRAVVEEERRVIRALHESDCPVGALDRALAEGGE